MEFVERLGEVLEEGRASCILSVTAGLALSLLLSPAGLSCAGSGSLDDETVLAIPGENEAGTQAAERVEAGLVAAHPSSAARAACAGDPGIGSVGFREARGVAEVQVEPRPGALYLALGLEDAAITARVHDYDGSSERAFACVPLRAGPYGETRYQRIELPWAESIEHDGHHFDVHRTVVPVVDAFATSVWTYSRGVYFGLETARGTVWAQWPGDDRLVRAITDDSPTLRPLPEPHHSR